MKIVLGSILAILALIIWNAVFIIPGSPCYWYDVMSMGIDKDVVIVSSILASYFMFTIGLALIILGVYER